MMRPLKRLSANERGASVIELALALPFLGAIVVGMTDISRAYSMKLRLEQAAQRSIEKIAQQTAGSNDYSAVGTEAAAAATAAGYSSSTVTLNYRLECNGTVAAQTTGGPITTACTGGQTAAKYVTVTIANAYTPMFATSYFPGANANGTVNVSGYAGLRVQ